MTQGRKEILMHVQMARILIFVFFLLANPAYARRYQMPLNEQFQKADCVVSAVLLERHTVGVKNASHENGIAFTLFEFKVKKDIKTANYGALVGEIVYVISQTQPEWREPHEPERRAPDFARSREYILFLKETPSYYLFNVVQDSRESIEYSDEVVQKLLAPQE